jgi:hypothetical protein
MGSNFTNGDPSNTGFRPPSFGSFTVPQDADASLTSSEGAIRHNKASLSVESAFAAEGFGSAPAGLAALVADYVNRSTRDIPVNKLANMSPGSGNLGTAAAAGVNVVLGSLTPVQRDVMKAGGNPFSTADMQHFAAKLGISGYMIASAKGESGLGGSNGSRFVGMKDGAIAKEGTAAFAQQAATFAKMSGDDFAARLGFPDSLTKDFGKLFDHTSGTFRATALDYKNVMADPNATEEQRKAAADRMHRNAKTPDEKEKAKKFQDVIEKMKADGVDLNNKDAVAKYKAEHPEIGNIIDADKRKNDRAPGPSATTPAAADKTVKAEVAASIAAAPTANNGDPKKAPRKPATIKSTL